MQFMTSRKAQIECDRLAEASGLDRIALDRIVVAMSIAHGQITLDSALDGDDSEPHVEDGAGSEWDGADGSRRDYHRLDSFDGVELFGPVLEGLHKTVLSTRLRVVLLRRHINRGFDILYRIFESCGKDWEATAIALSPKRRQGPKKDKDRKVKPLIIDVGKDFKDGSAVQWMFNREGGGQTNSNARIAGKPGVGKSQFLLNLLCSMVEQDPECGFILFDYKGDLAPNKDFVRATGAKVIRPGDEPIPINPFQLPESANLMLAPRAFAELFRVLAPRIGAVQERLVTMALQRCYGRRVQQEQFAGDGVVIPMLPDGEETEDPRDYPGTPYPTLAEIAEAIQDIYEEEGRGEDTLLATVSDLSSYNLFAEVSQQPIEDVFKVRWIIDLAGLQALRTFVGFVLMEFLHQAARSLSDTAYDEGPELRAIRGVVAVDEAHYYIRERCQPLLDLLRVGRSKGIPVFLSSQSLEDFKRYTELNEFLTNTFVLSHGVPPDTRTMAGALHTDMQEGKTAAARTATLDKFHAFATIAAIDGSDQGTYRHLVLKGFWERRGR